MTERASHTFEFSASQIAKASTAEAEYHESRVDHWEGRRDRALDRVKETIGAKVSEFEATNGNQVSVVVDYGDPEAWQEYQLAYRKVQTHREAAERYRTDERVYGTQGDRPYALDTDDVHHFRLGGQEREA